MLGVIVIGFIRTMGYKPISCGQGDEIWVDSSFNSTSPFGVYCGRDMLWLKCVGGWQCIRRGSASLHVDGPLVKSTHMSLVSTKKY